MHNIQNAVTIFGISTIIAGFMYVLITRGDNNQYNKPVEMEPLELSPNTGNSSPSVSLAPEQVLSSLKNIQTEIKKISEDLENKILSNAVSS